MDFEDYDLALAIERSLLPIIPIRHNEFMINCKKLSNLAMITLFPDDNDYTFSIHDEDLQKRLHYMSSEYHVFLKRVRTLDEAISVVQTIKSQYNIGHLEIGGHGTPTTIKWPHYTIEVNKDRFKLNLLFSYLDLEASIMTLSCFNGKAIKGDNILDYFGKIALGHRVIGTQCENGKHLSLKLSCPRPLKIKYKRGNMDVTAIKYYTDIY